MEALIAHGIVLVVLGFLFGGTWLCIGDKVDCGAQRMVNKEVFERIAVLERQIHPPSSISDITHMNFGSMLKDPYEDAIKPKKCKKKRRKK